jgi:hypothetical protein
VPTLRPTPLPPAEHTTSPRHSGVDASLVDSCTGRPRIRRLPSHKRTPSEKGKKNSHKVNISIYSLLYKLLYTYISPHSIPHIYIYTTTTYVYKYTNTTYVCSIPIYGHHIQKYINPVPPQPIGTSSAQHRHIEGRKQHRPDALQHPAETPTANSLEITPAND